MVRLAEHEGIKPEYDGADDAERTIAKHAREKDIGGGAIGDDDDEVAQVEGI